MSGINAAEPERMKSAAPAAGDVPSDSAWHAHEIRALSLGLILGNGLSMVCISGGSILDHLLYPSQFFHFLSVRLGVITSLLAIAGVVPVFRTYGSLPWIKTLGVSSALAVNFAFCWMIYRTNGAISPYYADLNLTTICWSALMPWTIFETMSMCVMTYAAYAAACLANGGGRWPFFGCNSFFILITAMICPCITWFLGRLRFEDFRLKCQLDVQNRELRNLDRIKTQFFTNVSHEMRTPLTLILGPVETLLGQAGLLESRMHESLLLAHRNALRLLKLTNDLLDLNRIDHGAKVLRRRNFALGGFVKETVDSVRHLGLSKRLRINIQESESGAQMFADPSKMEKVLVNLLTNAFKYTPAGGTITTRWSADKHESRLEVEDTGVGIPAEDLSKIFDRFHQIQSNMANRNQGIGIGLALARELVEEHDGRLEVESEFGRGTTFRIRLPAAATVPETASPHIGEASARELFEHAFRSADRSWHFHDDTFPQNDLSITGTGSQTILIADDEHEMRGYIVSLLSEEYRIVQTADGNMVAGLVEEHGPDLVLLDWMIPGTDSLAICRTLRSIRGHDDLKIVLLTSRAGDRSIIDALQAGVDDFLTKPFSGAEARARVANLLLSARLQKDIRNRNAELVATLEKLQRTA